MYLRRIVQRQVGKSTMLYHIKEEGRRYVTLDDGTARRLAENAPALFFETYGYPLLIDEFQRVPSILLEMKKIVDQRALNGEDNSGMYWLTGSQKFQMMQNISESLAGRVAVFDMANLSSAEIEGRPAAVFRPDLESLRERLRFCRKKSAHPDKNFSVLQKLNMDVQPGVVLCRSDELFPYNRDTWFCPVSVL